MLDQDKMIDNEDSVQLSEYCFDVCDVLNTAMRGKSRDDLNGSMEMKALEKLERCAG